MEPSAVALALCASADAGLIPHEHVHNIAGVLGLSLPAWCTITARSILPEEHLAAIRSAVATAAKNAPRIPFQPAEKTSVAGEPAPPATLPTPTQTAAEVRCKSRDALQCHRCQHFHHAASRCYAQPNCVKCGEPHLSRDCERERAVEPTCYHCKGNHTANYRGCKHFPSRKPVPQPQRQQQQTTVRSAIQHVAHRQPGMSYSQAVSRSSATTQPEVAAGVPQKGTGQPRVTATPEIKPSTEAPRPRSNQRAPRRAQVVRTRTHAPLSTRRKATTPAATTKQQKQQVPKPSRKTARRTSETSDPLNGLFASMSSLGTARIKKLAMETVAKISNASSDSELVSAFIAYAIKLLA